MTFHFLQEEAVHDTLAAAKTAAHGAEGGNLFTELFEHAHDARELELPFIGHVHLPQFDPIRIAGITIDLSITKHVAEMHGGDVLVESELGKGSMFTLRIPIRNAPDMVH